MLDFFNDNDGNDGDFSWNGTTQRTYINDEDVLALSLSLYGSVLVGSFLLFLILRRLFPRAYNLRNWVDSLKTHLAEQPPHRGFVASLWHTAFVRTDETEDEEFLQECGMDATCSVRIIRMGFRLSLVALFNMIWLIPVYYTAKGGLLFFKYNNETNNPNNDDAIVDRVSQSTISNVPAGNSRLFATVVASYILFGYTMYDILLELDWYIQLRHKFLRQPLPRHFTIFVRNIPPEYRQNRRLARFFRQCFFFSDDSAVLEAHIPIKTPNLERIIAQRNAVLTQLERALARYKSTLARGDGIRPRHQETILLGRTVDSIHYYNDRLIKLNHEVAERISALHQAMISDEFSSTQSSDLAPVIQNPTTDDPLAPNISELTTEYSSLLEHSRIDKSDVVPSDAMFSNKHRDQTLFQRESSLLSSSSLLHPLLTSTAASVATVATVATKATQEIAAKAVAVVASNVDGEVHSSGFVVFSRRSTVNAALHMIHHPKPFAMEVLEAPDPEDVRWENVWRKHNDILLGKLASILMTASLCLFWTVPTSFLASLSSSNAVREQLTILDQVFDKYPTLVVLIQQLAPLLLVLLNSLLPVIFERVALIEGHISSGMVAESVYQKTAFFVVIQTFFISALSGGVVRAIAGFIEHPRMIVDFLAQTLPDQATYFMQVILVNTAREGALEMLRITPLIQAGLRSIIGPRLTEKDRARSYWGLRPLCNPRGFSHCGNASHWVLVFMILFVYAVISPLTAVFAAFSFLCLASLYRYQFVHNYPKNPDSGGKIWAQFIKTLLTCMMIAQVTIIGLLSLKKAVRQVPLLIPLLVVTFLFNLYIRDKHFLVASSLPSRECVKEDLRGDATLDFSFVHGAYIQPSLAVEKFLLPDPSLLVDEVTDPSVTRDVI